MLLKRCFVTNCPSSYDKENNVVSMFSVPKGKLEEWQEIMKFTNLGSPTIHVFDELVNISHYENVVGDEAASGCITGIADVDQNDGARCSLITTEHAGETPAMATMGQFIENVYFFV